MTSDKDKDNNDSSDCMFSCLKNYRSTASWKDYLITAAWNQFLVITEQMENRKLIPKMCVCIAKCFFPFLVLLLWRCSWSLTLFARLCLLSSIRYAPGVHFVCVFAVVRGPTVPKISPQMFRTRTVHTSGTFFEIFRKMSKNNFKPCSHIELNTTNPNTIFKITVYYTKTPNMLKYFRNLEK